MADRAQDEMQDSSDVLTESGVYTPNGSDEDQSWFSEDDSGSDVDDGFEEVSGSDHGPLYDLGQALANSHSNCRELSFGGPADFLPADPGLHVDGFGAVSLPLTNPDQAEALSRVCEQAPYGRGHDTLVDTKVRNSWQLSPDRLSLRNAEWDKGLQTGLTIIADRFDIHGVPITAKLYKFLLYKPGGHFHKHRDTE